MPGAVRALANSVAARTMSSSPLSRSSRFATAGSATSVAKQSAAKRTAVDGITAALLRGAGAHLAPAPRGLSTRDLTPCELQEAMDLRHHVGAFADGAAHALHRVGAHVADGEHPRHARAQ